MTSDILLYDICISSELTLRDRSLKCSCGLEIDRDVNAAINIKQECLKAVETTVLKLVEAAPLGEQ